MRRFNAGWMIAMLAGLVWVGGGTPAQAHHSFPTTYLLNQTITIQGTVMTFLFRNPHSFVNMMAPDQTGHMVMWQVEWGSEAALERTLEKGTLKPGDKVIVTGNPARHPNSHRLRMNAIERPSDGWKWAGPSVG